MSRKDYLAGVSRPAINTPTGRSDDAEHVDLERHHRLQAAMSLPEAADLREQSSRMEAAQAHSYLVRRIQSGSTIFQVLDGMTMAIGKAIGLMVVDGDHDRLSGELLQLMRAQITEDRLAKAHRLAAEEEARESAQDQG